LSLGLWARFWCLFWTALKHVLPPLLCCFPHLKVSTDSWFRNHFVTGRVLCPVKSLVLWFSLNPDVSPEKPLFTWQTKSGPRSLTRRGFSKELKEAAVAAGHQGADYAWVTQRPHRRSNSDAGGWCYERDGEAGWALEVRHLEDLGIYARYSRGIMKGVAADMVGARVVSGSTDGFFAGG
jgi:hypothetical protein